MSISISYLQEYTKKKNIDFNDREYLQAKFVEEAGKLVDIMKQRRKIATENDIKNTIEEEICDVIMTTILLANAYDIDIEKWIPIKEKLQNAKYKNNVVFMAE